jgi:hypothetical protein
MKAAETKVKKFEAEAAKILRAGTWTPHLKKFLFLVCIGFSTFYRAGFIPSYFTQKFSEKISVTDLGTRIWCFFDPWILFRFFFILDLIFVIREKHPGSATLENHKNRMWWWFPVLSIRELYSGSGFFHPGSQILDQHFSNREQDP